ncbi:MAG: hypothetical protein Q9182_002183 [Xanthomendoza sp. 2 TL-2023]
MAALSVASVPFRPSLLRNNYVPRSPASPLDASGSNSSTRSSCNPPPSPEQWIWQCHECRTTYPIGTTRRCLLDDHQLCYGQPVQKNSKRGKKKVRSCQSQFDYTGWQAWGTWKRSQLSEDGQSKEICERNCGLLCDWPSECRWSRQQDKQEEHACPDDFPEPAVAAPETVAAPAREEVVTETPKFTESLISKIGTATQKITSHWTSRLSPIEEESSPTDIAAIEEFLRSAKTKTQPTTASENIDVPRHDFSISHNSTRIAPLQIVKRTPIVAERPHSDCEKPEAEYNVFELDLDFDFGFQTTRGEEDAVPSLTDGLKDLVAGTVGIALSTPTRGQRCVSEPPARSRVKRQRAKRRSSN